MGFTVLFSVKETTVSETVVTVTGLTLSTVEAGVRTKEHILPYKCAHFLSVSRGGYWIPAIPAPWEAAEGGSQIETQPSPISELLK